MSFPTTDQLFRDKQEDTTQLKITRQLVMLHAASCNISATLDNTQVVDLVVREFSTLLSASACFLGLWNEKDTQLEFVADHRPDKTGDEQAEFNSIVNLHPSLTEKILSRRNVLQISKETPGVDKDIIQTMDENGLTSLLLLPLIVNNQSVGLIEVLNTSENPYETYEIVIARLLANQAGISIENARLYQNAKQEILARQETEKKLRFTALHDVLTSLPNRVLFLDRLEQAISRYKRFENLEYAVLFVDLDRFKRINDSCGHIEGDSALRDIARRLQESVREGDTVCRFGGDEFLILLEGELNSGIIKEVTDRIQSNLSSSILIDEHEFHITASIGISYCVPDMFDASKYVQYANLAMYQAKAKGGGRTEVFTQTKGLKIKNEVILESAVREAARKKAFHLNFQPIYNLDSLSIVGVEALVRWEKENKFIPPAKFIPLLENLGLMPELGLWILQTAIESYRTWSEYDGVSNLSLGVNISNLQLIQEDFISQITRIIESTKMDPRKLNLEITEHVLIDDLELAKRKIHALNDLGIKVHLDDFGTGYSSLSYLNDLPIQALKIDRKFVKQINPSETDQGLVSSILAMARKYKADVIAEGIETEKQLRGLRYVDCQYGQGNFLSPALSQRKLLELLRTSPFLS